jgi:hypothetical protein
MIICVLYLSVRFLRNKLQNLCSEHRKVSKSSNDERNAPFDQIASANENSTLLIAVRRCPEGLNADDSLGVSSISEPMDTEWRKALAMFQTELESLLDSRLEGEAAVEAQRETQPQEEVTLQKIKQEVGSVIRQCEDQTQERLQIQLHINEGYKKIMEKQDEMQQQLQLWGEELRHEGNGEYCDQPLHLNRGPVRDVRGQSTRNIKCEEFKLFSNIFLSKSNPQDASNPMYNLCQINSLFTVPAPVAI